MTPVTAFRLLLACLLGMPMAALAQPSTSLCTDSVPLRMELTLNYKDLTRGRYDDYRPAPVRITLPDGSVDSGRMPLKPRGNFRQNYCHFPPLKLDFGEAGFTHPALAELPKLKLVTHCRDSRSFYQYVFLEYHIYQVYQLLTPMSLGVRLVEITYRDEAGKKAPFTRMAFLIEDIDDLAARNGCRELEVERVSFDDMDAEQLHRMAMFQLMVGNLDWYIGNLHNLKLIQNDDPARPTVYPVPYDFDYTGLVNARYAVAPERLDLSSVKDRCYLGPCPDEGRIDALTREFLVPKEAILAIFAQSPYLDSYSQAQALSYLNEFFDMLERPQQIERLITATCRQ